MHLFKSGRRGNCLDNDRCEVKGGGHLEYLAHAIDINKAESGVDGLLEL